MPVDMHRAQRGDCDDFFNYHALFKTNSFISNIVVENLVSPVKKKAIMDTAYVDNNTSTCADEGPPAHEVQP